MYSVWQSYYKVYYMYLPMLAGNAAKIGARVIRPGNGLFAVGFSPGGCAVVLSRFFARHCSRFSQMALLGVF